MRFVGIALGNISHIHDRKGPLGGVQVFLAVCQKLGHANARLAWFGNDDHADRLPEHVVRRGEANDVLDTWVRENALFDFDGADDFTSTVKGLLRSTSDVQVPESGETTEGYGEGANLEQATPAPPESKT